MGISLGLTSKCGRCGRNHTGICGIPPRRASRSRDGVRHLAGTRAYRPPARPGADILEKLLADGQGQLSAVLKMLKTVPAELPEYAALLDKEGQLDRLLKQLAGQIEAKRT